MDEERKRKRKGKRKMEDVEVRVVKDLAGVLGSKGEVVGNRDGEVECAKTMHSE